MEYGRGADPITPVVATSAITILPATGGNRSVITYVAIATIVLGAAILLSGAVRFVSKRR